MQLKRAFSDQMAAKLTGLSVGQLRAWDKQGFYSPSLAEENRRLAYSRVYSFKDIVALRVISALKTKHGVSTQHLKKVGAKLQDLGDDVWSKTRLYVLNKRVVFDHPKGLGRQEVVSGQRVFAEIPLRIATAHAEDDVAKLFQRDKSKIGHIDSGRHVMAGEPVVAGTRIPVRTIKSYLDMGLSENRILNDFPSLTKEDVRAAVKYLEANAA